MSARRAFAAGLAAAVLAGSGCGGSDRSDADVSLTWAEGPRTFRPETLPRDRILQGELVSESGRQVELRAEELRLLDEEGREIEASIAFISGYAPSIEPLNQLSELPEDEERRIGRLATVGSEPVPVTVSWSQPRGTGPPAELDYGEGSLPL